MTAAILAVCCTGAYLLVAGTQTAASSRGGLYGVSTMTDKSYRVLRDGRRPNVVQLAAQVETRPNVLSDAAFDRTEKPVEPSTTVSRTKMTSVERIRLRVWGGNPDFNGEYGIDPDMTLSLPGLGRFDITDHTPASLEQMLTEKLSNSMRRETRVSVEVTRSRPFFIMGQISRPGAVEWRPGLTLMQAIALAGGVTRPTTGGGLEMESQVRAQLSFSLAQLARLRAEKEDVAAIDVEVPLRASVAETSPVAELAAYGQKTILDEQRAVFQTRIANLQSEHRSALREIDAARAQANALQEQRDLSREATKNLEYLKDKQLVANRMYLTQRTELSNIEARVTETTVALERAMARAEALKRQITLAKQERLAALSERIETLDKEVVTLRSRLGSPDGTPAARRGIDIFLSRNNNGEFDVNPVSVYGEVNPGDVVIVVLRGRDGPDVNDKAAMLQWVLEASAQLPSTVTGAPDASRGSTR